MQSFAARTHQVRPSLLHGINGQRRSASRPIGKTEQRPYRPAAEFRPCVKLDHDRRSASYSKRGLGCGCGASVASIMRRSLAPWPSSDGDRTRQTTDRRALSPLRQQRCDPPASRVARQSYWASVRFRPTSMMRANATVIVSVLWLMPVDYRGSPENVCSSVDNRSSAAGGKGPFSTAASAFSN